MEKFAQKLMSLENLQSTTKAETAIFGTAGSLSQSLSNRPPHRIGMWPCISETHPEVALGLFTALALYLERWQSVRVYRLFINLGNEPENFVWDISKSQFEVEEWHVEGLDENIGMWGKLTFINDDWTLTIELETDSESDEEIILTFRNTTLSGLVNSLTEIARSIVESISIQGIITDINTQYTGNEPDLESLLKMALDWEMKCEMFLWGGEWAEEHILKDHEKLVSVGRTGRSEFGAWLVSALSAHAMKPGFENLATVMVDRAFNVVDELESYSSPVRMIAPALFRVGQVQDGIRLLEQGVQKHPQDANIWVTLAESQRLAGRLNDALDVYQSAIEQDSINFVLFIRYANLLKAMVYDEREVNDFILCDVAQVDDNYIKWEIVEAYEEAIQLEPEHPEIAQVVEQQIYELIQLGAFRRAIQRFNKLVQVDGEGSVVRQVIDSLYDLYGSDQEDQFVEDVVSILRNNATQSTDIRAKINLATAYIVNEEEDRARLILEQVEAESHDPDILTDVKHLLLTIDDPDFEMRLTDMRQILDAGNELSMVDLDYLEDILERAPTLSEIYILLSKAYLAIGESEDALEVLLDGHKEVPNDPGIIVQLADVLWEADQDELALDYLENAVQAYPADVPLLAALGKYHFEIGNRDEARLYMARAEAIYPNDPALKAARTRITNLISEAGGEEE